MATQYSNARIVTDGIVLALNAADPNSYVNGSSTWFDLSGNNLTGSLINAPTYSSSNSGNFIFNGTNQNADLSNPSVLNVHLAFTLSTWFKLSSSANYQVLIARGRGGGQWNGYELSFNGGTRTLRATSENAAGSLVTFDLVSNRVVDDGNWHYGVFTFNGTTGIMYVDGTTAGSSTGYFNSNSYTNYVGRRAAGQYFSGSIANVGIYNKALSATEVQQNYNAQKSRFENLSQDIPPPPTPSISVTPSVSITPSVTVSATPSVSITPSVTVSATPSVSITPSITPTITPSVSVTPAPTVTPTVTPTRTPSVSITPSATPFINNQIWQYDPTTTMSSPSSGNLRFNSSTISAVTQIAINNSGASSASLTAASGQTLVVTTSNGAIFLRLLLNQNSVNNTTWQLYTGTVSSNAGSFTAGLFLNLRII